jgi:hypothetical protein
MPTNAKPNFYAAWRPPERCAENVWPHKFHHCSDKMRLSKREALQEVERAVVRQVLDSLEVASNLIYAALEHGLEDIARQWHDWCRELPYNTRKRDRHFFSPIPSTFSIPGVEMLTNRLYINTHLLCDVVCDTIQL